MTTNQLKTDSFEKKIYNLCNGVHTYYEIGKKSGKTPEYIGTVINRLKKKGLITIEIKKKKKYPKRI